MRCHVCHCAMNIFKHKEIPETYISYFLIYFWTIKSTFVVDKKSKCLVLLTYWNSLNVNCYFCSKCNLSDCDGGFIVMHNIHHKAIIFHNSSCNLNSHRIMKRYIAETTNLFGNWINLFLFCLHFIVSQDTFSHYPLGNVNLLAFIFIINVRVMIRSSAKEQTYA